MRSSRQTTVERRDAVTNFPELTTASLTAIRNLHPGHPVYEVILRDGQSCAVKADNRGGMGATAPTVAAFDARLMGLISPNARRQSASTSGMASKRT